jgi:hypothetical protein
MNRLLTLIVLASAVHAQDDLAEAARSPYTLQRYVDRHPIIDWAPMWRALNINANEVFLPTAATPQGGRAATAHPS